MKKFFLTLLFLICSFFYTNEILAATFHNVEKKFEVGISEKIIGDQYINADEHDVNIFGHVEGDVFAHGKNVNITGTVDNDLYITAGEKTTILGKINDDVKVLTNKFHFDGEIKGDLMVLATSSILFSQKSVVYGDVFVLGGGKMHFNGVVMGEVYVLNYADGENNFISFEGIYHDDVHLDAGVLQVLKKESSIIKKGFAFSTSKINKYNVDKVLGETNVRVSNAKTSPMSYVVLVGILLLVGLIIFLTLLFIVIQIFTNLFLYYCCRNKVEKLFKKTNKRIFFNFFVGFLSLLVLIGVNILLFFIPFIKSIAIFMVIAEVFLIFVLKILVVTYVGCYAVKVFKKEKEINFSLAGIFIGILVVQVIGMFLSVIIPFIYFFITLALFGSLLNYIWQDKIKK